MLNFDHWTQSSDFCNVRLLQREIHFTSTANIVKKLSQLQSLMYKRFRLV